MAKTKTEQKPNAPKYLGCLTCSVSGLSGLSEVFSPERLFSKTQSWKIDISGQDWRWTGRGSGEEKHMQAGEVKKKRNAGFTENEKIEHWRKTKNIEKEAWKSDFYW